MTGAYMNNARINNITDLASLNYGTLDLLKNKQQYEIIISKKDDVLLDVLKDDDVVAFEAWLRIIAKGFAPSVLDLDSVDSKSASLNRNSRLFKWLSDPLIHTKVSGIDIALSMLDAMVEFKSYRCFSLLANYENLNLLTDCLFWSTPLIESCADVIAIKGVAITGKVYEFRSQPFVYQIASQSADDAAKWINSDLDFWKKYLRLSGGFHNLTRFLRGHTSYGTEFVAALGVTKLISLDIVKEIMADTTSIHPFHPETVVKIEKSMLADKYKLTNCSKTPSVAL